MKLRKVLSMVLCLCMLLACIPAIGIMAEETTQQTVRIEAEDATWNKYAKATDAAFSGGAGLGNANGDFFTWNEISSDYFLRNKWVYVVYYVDAPEAGTYQVSVAATVKMNEACTPYAALLVNPVHGKPAETYKVPYAPIAANTATYMVSEKVDVQLVKGRNVIYMTPFTGDQPRNWANTDYIEITGAQAVTPIAPQQVTLPANVGYYAKAGVAAADRLEDTVFAPINDRGIHAENVTRADLKDIAHTAITVEAPADGYYRMTYNVNGPGEHGNGQFALAMFVDDSETAEVKRFTWNSGEADVSTYLTKGIHTLTLTTVMPKDQAAADANDAKWNHMKGLTITGGLKLAKYQYSPSHAGNVLEAERDGYVWRYPDIDTNEKNLGVGGAQPGATKQTFNELSGGAKLNKNQPMVTYYIDVETAGTYTINNSFRGYTGNDYYMIVSVDDVNYYKAGINGTDPSRANRWLTTAAVELTAGRHYVRLITLPQDTGAGWCNVDYTEFAGPGNVRAMKDQLHLSATEAHYMQGFESTGVDHSGNGAQWVNAIGKYKGNSWASAAGVTTENFTFADLAHLGWFSYTVNVPADGYYDLQTYLRPNTSTYGTGKILLVIDQQYRWVDVTLDKDASKWWIADLSSYLTKGDHVILVTGMMDYTGNSNDWCDMGALTVSGGITKSATPINPLHQGECVLEAESDGFIWRFTSTDQGQLGGSQPAGNSYNQSYEDIVADFEKRHQPSVSFVVDVTATGTYNLTASYRGYADPSYYIVISVDDETFVKTSYAGTDSSNSAFLLTKADVQLTEGRHVIRLLPLTKGTGAGWINLNYLKIEGVADVKKVDPQQTHLYAYDAPYILNFAKRDPEDLSQWGNAQWAKTLRGYQGNSCMEIAGVTSENFTLQDLGHMGWFSYTLNVPADGYYDLQTYIRPNNSTKGTGKILVVVDQEIQWVDVDFGLYDFKYDAVDLSRYFTKGDHTVLISGIVDYTAGSYDWCDMGALTVSGGITVSQNQVDPRGWLTPSVDKYSLSLGDCIGINFVLDGVTTSDKVTFHIGETKLESKGLDGGKYIAYVAAAQMTEQITIQVNDKALDETYCVKTYADTILSGDFTAETKALVTEMLNYGGASQVCFGYNTENLAAEVVERTLPTDFTASTEAVIRNNISGLKFYGASLLFKGKTAVRFYFSGDMTDCVFTVGEQAYTPVEKDGLWYVEIGGIAPNALMDAITLDVVCGEQSIQVVYSPMNYIERMYNKDSVSKELKDAIVALYYYYDAAIAYLNSIA